MTTGCRSVVLVAVVLASACGRAGDGAGTEPEAKRRFPSQPAACAGDQRTDNRRRPQVWAAAKERIDAGPSPVTFRFGLSKALSPEEALELARDDDLELVGASLMYKSDQGQYLQAVGARFEAPADAAVLRQRLAAVAKAPGPELAGPFVERIDAGDIPIVEVVLEGTTDHMTAFVHRNECLVYSILFATDGQAPVVGPRAVLAPSERR
jgi:hypothetical protein